MAGTRPAHDPAGPAGQHTSTTPAAGPTGRPGLLAELNDAVSVRTVSLVVGVLLLQLAFILSYVGAFHAPTPHHVRLAVVAPQPIAARTVDALNSLPSHPVAARASDEAAARRRLARGEISGALLIDPSGTTDTLLVAGGGGAAVVTALEQVVGKVEAAQQRTVLTEDVVPLQPGDARGLTGFYLVIGWIVGGYLVAALLGVAKGSRPANPNRAAIRLLSVLPYAVASGFGGAAIVGPLLGALDGNVLALGWLGALIVFAVAAVTMAFQVLLGVLGIGLAVLVFVVLGNPSASGAYQLNLLPAFWRAIGNALPNGAGTDTVRRIVYFGGHGTAGHLWVIGAYAIGGVLVTMLAAMAFSARDDPTAPRSHS